jgi:xanthine/uracil/vitamin C permease (AzgA family)
MLLAEQVVSCCALFVIMYFTEPLKTLPMQAAQVVMIHHGKNMMQPMLDYTIHTTLDHVQATEG